LLVKAINGMFPDVANKDGKRMLLATDWHSSRLDLNFLNKLRDMGVVLIGWLPNTTSKMQSPDVELFGVLKSHLTNMRDAFKRANPDVGIDRYETIRLAGCALIKTFNNEHCLAGAKKTGIAPFDPNVLLNHAAVFDGDKVDRIASKSMAKNFVNFIQSPSSTSSSGASETSETDSVWTSISQQKPRIGPYAEAFTSGDNEMLALLRSSALNKLSEAIVRQVESQPRRIQRIEEELKRKEKEQKVKLTRELDNLQHWQRMLQDVDLNDPLKLIDARHTISILSEKIDDVGEASRDSFGVPREEQALPAPSLAQVTGISCSPLRRMMNTTGSSLARVSAPSRTDGSARFVAGSIIRRTLDIELTGDPIVELTTGYFKRKRATEREENERAKIWKKKLSDRAESLPDRFEKAERELKRQFTDSSKASVTRMKAYLTLVKEKARLDKDDVTWQAAHDVCQLKATNFLTDASDYIKTRLKLPDIPTNDP